MMTVLSISQTIRSFLSDNFVSFRPMQVPHFLFALFVCALLSYVLGLVYIRYGNSLSNRKAFAKNFVLLAATTLFIISVVKSSLALSLGLVGALSIVRFRSAIKEPEELAYLFLNIAIGLGCGAGQVVLTVLAYIAIVFFIFLNKSIKSQNNSYCFYLLISNDSASNDIEMSKIIQVIELNSDSFKLKRSEKSDSYIEVSFYIDINNLDKLDSIKEQVEKLDNGFKITVMDTSRDF